MIGTKFGNLWQQKSHFLCEEEITTGKKDSLKNFILPLIAHHLRTWKTPKERKSVAKLSQQRISSVPLKKQPSQKIIWGLEDNSTPVD